MMGVVCEHTEWTSDCGLMKSVVLSSSGTGAPPQKGTE
jgi:hypothetical protein